MFDKGEKHDQFYAFQASQFGLKKTYKYKNYPSEVDLIHSRNDDKFDSSKSNEKMQYY